jgi:Putative transposase
VWRQINCSALVNEREWSNAAGHVVLKLKTPCRDDTTHLVLSPLVFMQRLAALVPGLRLSPAARTASCLPISAAGCPI